MASASRPDAASVVPHRAIVPRRPTPDGARVTARLRELYAGHRLSPAQRRIARYLLDTAEEAVFLTSIDIAKAVGVSQPSVTRFAFALGFEGFPEFRENLRDLVRAEGSAPPRPAGRNRVQLLLDEESRALARMADNLTDLSALERVAAELGGSRPLPVLGLRVSAPLAQYVGYFAAKVLPDVRVLVHGGSGLVDQLTRAADAGASWLLALGLPRYPQELFDALVFARGRGLRIALLTDQGLGPLADLADELLVAPVNSDFAFDSPAAPAAMCAALLHTMLESLPTEQQAALEEFEAIAADRRVFLLE